ncbi:MAG: hypothetical protein LBR22_04465 [Desulfovibrio sp.]|jgi:hypothetical protein|nr:hypothetical protein [Desulfovibrio sp.]
MTKRQPFATKLRLSRLLRWTAALFLLKCAIIVMVALDFPMSALVPWQTWFASRISSPEADRVADVAVAPEPPKTPQDPEATRDAKTARNAGTQDPKAQSSPKGESRTPQAPVEDPQGSKAAKLAAATHPAPKAPEPVYVIHAQMPAPDVQQREANDLPTLEEMGTAPLVASAAPDRGREDGGDGILNTKRLTSLPVPGLGSIQAANAASRDIPIPAPQTPPASDRTNFTPSEQTAPMSQQQAAPAARTPSAAGATTPSATPGLSRGGQAAPTALPGAPAIPDSIPRGQDIIDRSGRNGAATPGLGRQSGRGAGLPVPDITRQPMPDDPDTKAQDLARQQQDILILRQQMDQRLKDLNAAEQKIKDMIREARGLEDQKIRHLIQMYANMKPKMAAKAIETMDERVAIRILNGMSPKQSGEILTYTAPEKTAKLTELITRMKLPE